MRTLIICLLAVFSAQCQDLSAAINLCANPPATPPKALSDKMALPDVYKVSGSISDLLKATTSMLVESSNKDYRVLEKQSRNSQKERWIQELQGDKRNLFLNGTAGKCFEDIPKLQLITNPNFLAIIGNDTSTYNSIIRGLLSSDKSHSGFLLDKNNQEIVGGIDANKWIACLNVTGVKNSSVLVEVRYAGEDSISPAVPEFSNPLILSIRLVELANFTSPAAIDHISIELDRYERPAGNEALIEHGVACPGGNVTLPLKRVSEFSGTVKYFNHETNQSQNFNVLYSKSRKILTISGEKSFENGVSFINAPTGYFINRTNYVVHDFQYGYEFTMSDDSCTSFSTLSNETYDVSDAANSTTYMRDFEQILLDKILLYGEYQSEVNLLGRTIRNFRFFDKEGETVHEIGIDAETQEITEIAVFHSVTLHLITTLKIERTANFPLDVARISDCYESGRFANNTWIIDLKNKNVTDLKSVGLTALNSALTESISKNVAPVIPYRVLVFWTQSADGGLQTMLRLAEKTGIVPSNTGFYNYTAELPTDDLFKLINQTISNEKLPLEVVRNDGVKEEWLFNAKSITHYPKPSNGSDFLGYTGGAMFVLAIFCLLIGVSIGAVGVFVATRRQRISTLAYQVFE